MRQTFGVHSTLVWTIGHCFQLNIEKTSPIIWSVSSHTKSKGFHEDTLQLINIWECNLTTSWGNQNKKLHVYHHRIHRLYWRNCINSSGILKKLCYSLTFSVHMTMSRYGPFLCAQPKGTNSQTNMQDFHQDAF